MPTPPVTLRRQFVELLKLRLKAISASTTVTLHDGSQYQFQTNLGARPIERKPVALQSDDLPALGIVDDDNKTVQDFPRQKAVSNTLSCQVRIFLKRNTDLDLADSYLGDVMRAIVTSHLTGKYEPTFGGLAVDTRPESDGWIRDRTTYEVEAAAVSFTVEFLSGPFNAYQ
jgi:hypothetical protein